MTASAPVVAADDPRPASPSVREMVRQLRALDRYGVLDGAGDEVVLDPLIMTRERRRELPLVADPDEEVVARVEAYYNALAVLIEQACGQVAVPLVQLSPEGFGRALIAVGRLIVIDRALRDVHRFGFRDLERMERDAARLLAGAHQALAAHPEAAGL